MIIAFAGRCQSGKTELAKICEKHGYERIFFALPLKQLCAKLLNVSLYELNKLKVEKTEIGITIGNDMCKILSEETEIPLDVVMKICNGVTIIDVRHMLQFIGTDLIRKYNMDWHVNRICAMINKDKDYVIDDVRFPNEKKMVEELGGDCWFVTRTTLDNISNHESETSIKWNDCWNRIIVNDSTLSILLFKWETFISDYKHLCSIRDKEFNRILENGTKNEITPLSMCDMLFLSKDMFNYIPKTIDKTNIKKITMNKDKTVFITYNDDSMEMIDNAIIIEELKSLF